MNAMKTRKHSEALINRKVVKGRDLSLLLVLPVFVLVMIAFASCGNNNKSVAELAPPPPPPPPISSADQVSTIADEIPQFKGGDVGLFKYIADNTIYPEEAKKNNITGRVIVKLVIEKDCSVSHVEVAQSINGLLDAEAIRVVSTLPKFEKPGIKDGKTVRVQFMIPISFILN